MDKENNVRIYKRYLSFTNPKIAIIKYGIKYDKTFLIVCVFLFNVTNSYLIFKNSK